MAKTGHPNVVLRMMSSWRGQQHKWSLVTNLSGGAFASQGDMQTICQQLWGVYSQFILGSEGGSTGESTGWLYEQAYYDGQNAGSLYSNVFNDPASSGANLGPVAGGGGLSGAQYCTALEPCVLLRAPAGASSSNKPVYLVKYIHGNYQPQQGQNFAASAGGAAALASLTNGTLTGNVFVISPSARRVTAPFAVDPFVSNHQMPRGRKRKADAANLQLNLKTISRILETDAGGE